MAEKKMADMHIHSTASDGRLTPEELIRMAEKIPYLAAIAITDHDTPEGGRRALHYGSSIIKIIAGIEFSCIYGEEEAHILGYYIDTENEDLVQTEKKMLVARRQRAMRFVEKLQEKNVAVTWDEVQRQAGGKAIGRPHIARAILRKGYVKTLDEAYEKYLSPQSDTYVPRQKMSVEEAVKVIEAAGGCSVLAHPAEIKNQSLIKGIIALGVKGIEVYHPSHDAAANAKYLDLAQRHGLFVTGGSDFHFNDNTRTWLVGDYGVECEQVRRMEEVYKK